MSRGPAITTIISGTADDNDALSRGQRIGVLGSRDFKGLQNAHYTIVGCWGRRLLMGVGTRVLPWESVLQEVMQKILDSWISIFGREFGLHELL